MIPTRKLAAVSLAVLVGAAVIAFSLSAQPQRQIPMPAQQPPSQPASTLNHNLILLDPAHGGPDPGATLGDHILEKDITLALAARLRTALTAAGFTVIATRDADPSVPLTTDQRAEIANRTHAVACVVLHATATGSGLHIYTSTLQQSEDIDTFAPFVPVPWDTAQATSVSQSQHLASDLASAFTKSSLPVLSGQAAVRPLDNLMCPAVAIEIAPLRVSGQDSDAPTTPTDPDYQQRVVVTLTSALQAWRDHADPQAESSPLSPETSAQSRAIAAANAAGAAAARSAARARARSALAAQKGLQ